MTRRILYILTSFLLFGCSKQPEPLTISVSFPTTVNDLSPITGHLNYRINLPNNDSVTELKFSTNYSNLMIENHYPYVNDAYGSELDPSMNSRQLFLDLFYLTQDSTQLEVSLDTINLSVSVTLKTANGINITKTSTRIIEHELSQDVENITDTIIGWYFQEDTIIANWRNSLKNGKVDIIGKYGTVNLNYSNGLLDGQQYYWSVNGDTTSVISFDRGTQLEQTLLIDTTKAQDIKYTSSNKR